MRLVARDVVVEFGPLRVLAGVDLAVASGETVAVLGPSGSGKSTLLAVLGGLLRPTAGRVDVLDDAGVVQRTRPADVVSWVLQTTNVLVERSVRDNVAVAGLARGLARGAALTAADERLADVGLYSRAGDRTGLLSGGEVQRVVIARALAAQRPFVLADEPTGQLDRSTSDSVLDAMFAAVRGSARTGLVVVTHDPAVAVRCERTVHIVDGQVVET